MALFDDYQPGDIYKYVPESAQTAAKELFGGAEVLTTVATSVPAQLIGIGKTAYEEATTQPDPTMLKEEKWLERNKKYSNNPDYKRVLKDYNYRQSLIVEPETRLLENTDAFTYTPRTEAGQRNLSAIGEGAEYLKIPPFSPGIGNIGRIAKKGKPTQKTVDDKKPNVTSESLFTRAKMYFDESKAAQVDFNNSAITNLANRMAESLKAENISDISSYGSTAKALINKMKLRAKMRKPISINELFEFRDLIDDVETANKPKSKFTSMLLREDLDDFIGAADDSVISKTSTGSKANIDAFKKGQKIYGNAKNTGLLESLIKKAERKLSNNYTQLQLVDAMKKEVNSVLNSERKSKYFTKQHKEVLNDFVKDSKIENLMKRLTKLDPKHGGYGMGPNVALTTAAGLGFGDVSTALYVSAGLFGTGTAAAMARDAALKNKISNVINKIQNRTVDVDTG